MKLLTTLRSSAALLLLLPLAVVRAPGPFPGIERELNEAVHNFDGFHLGYPSVNRSPGVIGEGRNRRNPTSRGFGGAGSPSAPVSYVDPAGSTSYFSVQPWAFSEHDPTSSNAVYSHYQRDQTLAHPGSHSNGPSRPSRQGQDSYSAVLRREEAVSNAASRRLRPAASSASHPSRKNVKAIALALEREFDDKIERLSAGSEENPSPTYVAISDQVVDHQAATTVPPDTQLSVDVQDQLVKLAKSGALWVPKEKIDAHVFSGLFYAVIKGQKIEPANKDRLLGWLKTAQAETGTWTRMIDVLLNNGVRHFGIEEAKAVLGRLKTQQQKNVFYSALRMDQSYRLRLQMENETKAMKASGIQWREDLFSLTLEESRQVAALAWYFIKAGEKNDPYLGMTQPEKDQLKEVMASRLQEAMVSGQQQK